MRHKALPWHMETAVMTVMSEAPHVIVFSNILHDILSNDRLVRSGCHGWGI
jgi:hypothetical protein